MLAQHLFDSINDLVAKKINGDDDILIQENDLFELIVNITSFTYGKNTPEFLVAKRHFSYKENSTKYTYDLDNYAFTKKLHLETINKYPHLFI